MKRILLLLAIITTLSLSTKGQTTNRPINRPVNPDNNVGLIIGPYTQVNVFDYLEFGALLGVNIKDVVIIGTFTQKSIKGNDFCGLYTQVNINPKQHYFNIGVALRSGFVNGKYLTFEPAMTIQQNLNNKFKLTHQIGFIGVWPTYNIGIIYGNFGMKWWKK